MTWTKAGTGMMAPPAASAPTDSFGFNRYEGSPTVVGFPTYSGDALQRTFVYATKFGSITNGSTVTGGSGSRFSTDVAILRSDDEGVNFGDPLRLTSPPPSGFVRWKVEFVTASNYFYSNAAPSGSSEVNPGWVIVAWKQTPVRSDGSDGSPQWVARKVVATAANAGLSLPSMWSSVTPAIGTDPWVISGVPGASGPISIAAKAGSTGPNVFVAFPSVNAMKLNAAGTTWDPEFACPNPVKAGVYTPTVDNTWVFLQATLLGTTFVSENVARDTQWRKCVGASRNKLTGTAHNKQLIRPMLAYDPMGDDFYVALSQNGSAVPAAPATFNERARVQVWRKHGGAAFTSTFESSDPANAAGVRDLHDAWAPVLSVNHNNINPAGPAALQATIFISYRSTRYDTLSSTLNERVNRLGNMSLTTGATWQSPMDGGWFVDHLTTPLAPNAWQGAYDGAASIRWLTNAFQVGWADPRSTGSQVYGATIIP